MVWGGKHVPKTSLILWLCCHGTLRTTDKISAWDDNVSPVCVLCGAGLDNKEHLFFECGFLGQVLLEAIKQVKLAAPPYKEVQVIAWMLKVARGKSLKAELRRAVFAVVIYAVWEERNYRKFRRKVGSVQSVCDYAIHLV